MSSWEQVAGAVEQAAQVLARATRRLPAGGLGEADRKRLARAVGQASQSLGVCKRVIAGQTKTRPERPQP